MSSFGIEIKYELDCLYADLSEAQFKYSTAQTPELKERYAELIREFQALIREALIQQAERARTR